MPADPEHLLNALVAALVTSTPDTILQQIAALLPGEAAAEIARLVKLHWSFQQDVKAIIDGGGIVEIPSEIGDSDYTEQFLTQIVNDSEPVALAAKLDRYTPLDLKRAMTLAQAVKVRGTVLAGAK